LIINEDLVSSLQEQLGHEKYNANLYLYIAGFLKNKGLENIAKHFEGQHDEETNHSKMIFDLLTDLNAPIVIPEIDGVGLNIVTILDIAKIYLDREVYTTDCLDDIKRLAIENQCPIVEEFMREMITLQQHEMAEANDFNDKAEITGGDWKWVMNWDLGLK
jgi:ferritin